jgi:hypothetical protein
MYFRDVPLSETLHRAVFYTNSWALPSDPIELPVGRFLFATRPLAITTVTIEALERLEAVRPNGQPELLIATSGDELLTDAAAVFAFALNVTCSRSATLVERLVPTVVGARPSSKPSNILRRTFDPGVFLRPEEIESAREFCTKLLALKRGHFEAAMRAIRSVVNATYSVSDNPGLAYTLLVAALESLAQLAISPDDMRSWDTYDGKKRKIIDSALVDADLRTEQATKIRDAVLKADQLSLARRFRAFTLGHIEPSFYRAEAAGASRPVRASDLPNALEIAYRFRSRNVHELQDLEPELWEVSDRADTLPFEGRAVLSLEGLNRICRHVINVFVQRSPTGIEPSFDYREALPGILRMELAPQYWIGNADGFTPGTAQRVLKGFLELLIDVLSDPSAAQLVDLSAVLEKIESALPSEAKPEARQPMIALYVLWHAFTDPVHRRPKASTLIPRYKADLESPSMAAFAIRVLTSAEIEWSTKQLLGLVALRRNDLRRGRGQPLPARLDTALLLYAAERLENENRSAEALSLISEAVESLPGYGPLLAFERDVQAGSKIPLVLFEFILAKNMWEPGNESST